MRNHTFVSSVWAWVHGFPRLGSWVHRLSSWILDFFVWVRCLGLLVRGFADWVHGFTVGFVNWVHGSSLGSSTGFLVSVFSVWSLVFSVLLTGFVVSLVVVDFFSKEEEEEEETEVSWVSFVELEYLKLEFHVNFNRNRVCDTWFATVTLSPLALRC